MVTFEQLAFSDDLQSLNIECSVDTTEDQSAHIKRIYLEYYKNRNATGAPSSKALLVWEEPVGGSPVSHVETTVYETQLSMTDNGVNTFQGGMFYVLVHWQDGNEDEHYDIGVVLDWDYVYQLGMQAIAGFTAGCTKGKCEIPEFFEQIVLVVHALQLAMEAQDMDQMDMLWSRFVQFAPLGSNVSPCNCH